jgi:integrase
MRLVTVYAPGADPRPLLAAYRAHLDRTGRGNASYWWAARDFFSRWPDPAMWAAEPLEVRLSASCAHRPVITFLMIHGHLRPGYDYLLERKISSLWRELEDTSLGEDLDRVLDAAAQLGFSERVATANASQVPARLLIQTGRRLGELTTADLDELAAAGREREQRTGQGWRHYQSGISFTHRVLFHLAILAAPPELSTSSRFAPG